MPPSFLVVGCLFLATLWVGTSRSGEIRPIANMTHITWQRPGDLTLGVILSLSVADPHTSCGRKLRRPSALHRLESLVFAVDEINRRTDLLPNITLGFVIMDDCSLETVALLRALHFIQKPPPRLPPGGDMEETGALHTFRSFPVVGVIGAELSASSMQMASLLSPFHIPQLSYASSSPHLSDKQRYKFFSRLVPSDRQQALLITDILEQFNWTYLTILYSYSVYGQSGLKHLLSALSEKKNYCVATSIMIESNFKDEDFDAVIEDLLKIKRSRVVVIFALEGLSILRAAQRKGVKGDFVWIASDAVLPNVQDFKGIEDASLGILLVGFSSNPVARFENALEHYTLNSRTENPWFHLFYQQMFDCSTELDSSPTNRTCDRDLPISASPAYARNTTVSRVFDAVYAYAHALHALTKDCHLAPHEASSCFTSEQLFETLRSNTTAFVGESDVPVGFDSLGDGPPIYQVKNLRVDNGKYSFVTVGEWDGRFRYFDKDHIMWHPGLLEPGDETPKSYCR